MKHLHIRGLQLAYGKSDRLAVDGLDLEVAQGELVSLLGPSGCGKTTTMRAIAGLLQPRGGQIHLDGQDITHLPTHKRGLGMVFQSYALFPHLSAFENVAFGLRLRQTPAAELKTRVDEALAAVGLQAFAERQPAQLSGGQQQRVALARAMVLRPRLMLLDEPLSNLDARLRVDMRAELRRLQRLSGITMVYVTHDQDEALSLSDRIVIMRQGRIEQQGTPPEIYHRPATAFVARFMGYDNLLRPVPDLPFAWPTGARQLAWRPQQVQVASADQPGLPGTVLARSYLGERLEVLVQTAAGPFKGTARGDSPLAEGDAVRLQLDPAQAAALQDEGDGF
ncbi:MAG: hypothetical protein RIQ38_443 [Pseudomonadota bacterium]|jgi:putative spermidine/putrescine transport system ATP-binding protein